MSQYHNISLGVELYIAMFPGVLDSNVQFIRIYVYTGLSILYFTLRVPYIRIYDVCLLETSLFY